MQNIQSQLLNSFKNITHHFTNKQNGNLAFHVNDDPDIVLKNHRQLANKLDYDYKKLVHMQQIHSRDVHIVGENDDFDHPPTCDALITNKKNTPLMVMVADCSPILFYDPTKKIIAVAHAGRQGAFKDIISYTIEVMRKNFGSQVKNIHVSIGPSIQACCYKVGEEIDKEVKNLNLHYAIEKREESHYLDISSILYKQLITNEIAKENIEISHICTCCNSDELYSYRADSQTGRFAGVIMLK